MIPVARFPAEPFRQIRWLDLHSTNYGMRPEADVMTSNLTIADTGIFFLKWQSICFIRIRLT